MTYNVSGGTLNLALSIYQSVNQYAFNTTVTIAHGCNKF